MICDQLTAECIYTCTSYRINTYQLQAEILLYLKGNLSDANLIITQVQEQMEVQTILSKVQTQGMGLASLIPTVVAPRLALSSVVSAMT